MYFFAFVCHLWLKPFVRSMPTKDMGPTKHECAREVDENFTIIKSLGEGKYAQVKDGCMK